MEIFRACNETGVKYCFAEQENWDKDYITKMLGLGLNPGTAY